MVKVFPSHPVPDAAISDVRYDKVRRWLADAPHRGLFAGGALLLRGAWRAMRAPSPATRPHKHAPTQAEREGIVAVQHAASEVYTSLEPSIKLLTVRLGVGAATHEATPEARCERRQPGWQLVSRPALPG